MSPSCSHSMIVRLVTNCNYMPQKISPLSAILAAGHMGRTILETQLLVARDMGTTSEKTKTRQSSE